MLLVIKLHGCTFSATRRSKYVLSPEQAPIGLGAARPASTPPDQYLKVDGGNIPEVAFQLLVLDGKWYIMAVAEGVELATGSLSDGGESRELKVPTIVGRLYCLGVSQKIRCLGVEITLMLRS